MFFPEANYRTGVSSPRSLLPLLVCWGCPVRRRCLEDAFQSWTYSHFAGVHTELGTSRSAHGIWGATTEFDREAVKELPPEEAIELLDRTTDGRMEKRDRLYLKEQGRKRRTKGASRGVRRIITRIDAMLEERGRARCDSVP
jgi:hypothetical protein